MELENETRDALGLTPDQMKRVKQAFRTMDENGNGLISSAELSRASHVLGYNPTATEVKKMIEIVDQDMNGQIDFQEFAGLMQERFGALEYQEMAVKEAFKHLDKDDSGFIDLDELRAAMTAKGDDPISDEEFKSIVDDLDVNKDGKIDYSELSRKMCSFDFD